MNYKKARQPNRRGFTLIETIIYIGILAFIIGSGFSAAFYIIDSTQKNKADINIQAEGNFVLRKIEWAMNGASAANLSGGDLLITKPNLPAGENPLKFSVSGMNVQLARGSGTPANLNSSLAPVADVVFSASSGRVTANFTIIGSTASSTFSTTKYLRK